MKAKDIAIDKLQSGAYFTEGSDGYWINNVQKEFTGLIEEDAREYNLHIIEKPTELMPIIEAVSTVSFFPTATVVIVRGGTLKFDAKKKELEKLLEAIPSDCYLLFVDVEFTPTDKKKMTAINCDKSDIFDAREIVFTMLPKNAIEGKAVDLLLEYTNRDLQRIEGEIQKLVAYTDGRQITASDVDALVVNSVENSVFEFSEAIATGNSKRALMILDRFTSRGVSYAYLLSILSGQYRRMLHGVLSKKSDAELAEALGTKEFAIKKARDATGRGKKLKPIYLKSCLETLTTAELNFKSGVMSEENAFKTAVVKLLEVK